MAAVRSRDTKPEIRLRRALHAAGLRFRIDAKGVFGRPDIVNRSRRVAVFVDGDFWHANPAGWLRRGFTSMEDQFPPQKREVWTKKLQRNAERDTEVTTKLEKNGWTVVRVWESEVQEDLDAVVARISRVWARG